MKAENTTTEHNRTIRLTEIPASVKLADFKQNPPLTELAIMIQVHRRRRGKTKPRPLSYEQGRND